MVQRLAWAAIVAVAGLSAGCGPRTLPQKQTHPVKGRIILNGKPASYVLVRFSPTGTEGVEAVGRTDRDGNFELRTYSNEGNDGAATGEYKVTIEDFDPVQGGDVPRGARGTKVPKGSMEAQQTYEIQAGDNELTVELP
jgi:hypothetical protein